MFCPKTVTPHRAMSYVAPHLMTARPGTPSSHVLHPLVSEHGPCGDLRPHLSGALAEPRPFTGYEPKQLAEQEGSPAFLRRQAAHGHWSFVGPGSEHVRPMEPDMDQLCGRKSTTKHTTCSRKHRRNSAALFWQGGTKTISTEVLCLNFGGLKKL